MKIRIRLFASLREVFGTSRLEQDFPQGVSAQDVVTFLDQQAPGKIHMGSLHIAVNKQYVDDDVVLKDGDEVAVFPPVSGGQVDSVDQDAKRFWLTENELSLDEVAALVTAPEHGAIVLFSGTVRGVTGDLKTDYLEYEAYVEMAEGVLAQIGDEVRERWPQILDVAIVHRIGRMEVGESSVMIAVAAAHRQGVFDACSYAIERLKRIVPIWKKEVGSDGSFWVEGPGGSGTE
jgi:molybdopterin synthase catalytic subunit